MRRRSRHAAKLGSQKLQSRGHRKLHLENLEPRQLLSASGFTTDTTSLRSRHAGSTISGYTPAQIRAAYGFNNVSFGSTAGRRPRPDDCHHRRLQRSEYRLAIWRHSIRHSAIAAPPSLKIVNESGGTTLPEPIPVRAGKGKRRSTSNGRTPSLRAQIFCWSKPIALRTPICSPPSIMLAQQTGVSVISMSWGSDDNAANASYDQNLSNTYLVTPSGHQGITFVASSGDDGHPELSLGIAQRAGRRRDRFVSDIQRRDHERNGLDPDHQRRPDLERRRRSRARNSPAATCPTWPTTPASAWRSTTRSVPTRVGLRSAARARRAAMGGPRGDCRQGRAAAGLGTLNGATQTLAAIYAAPAADFHDITHRQHAVSIGRAGYDLATGLGSPVANLLIPYLANYGGSGTVTTVTAPAAPANFTAQATFVFSGRASVGRHPAGRPATKSMNWRTARPSCSTRSAPARLPNGERPDRRHDVFVRSSGLQLGRRDGHRLGASDNADAAVAVRSGKCPCDRHIVAPLRSSVLERDEPERPAISFTNGTVTGRFRWLNWLGGTTSVSISGQAAGATEYFYVTAYNATSSASAIGSASSCRPPRRSRPRRTCGPRQPRRQPARSLGGVGRARRLLDLLLERLAGRAARQRRIGHDLGLDHRHEPGRDLLLLRRGIQQHECGGVELGVADHATDKRCHPA